MLTPKFAKSEQNSWVKLSQDGFRQGKYSFSTVRVPESRQNPNFSRQLYKTRGLETSPSFLKALVAKGIHFQKFD